MIEAAQRIEAADEFLAEMAETRGGEDVSVWKRIVAAVRGFFRRMGFHATWTDDEIADLFRQSRKTLKRNRAAKGEAARGSGLFSVKTSGGPATVVTVSGLPVDIKNTAAVRDYLNEHFKGREVRIKSDGRVTFFNRQGLEDTLKRRGEHRSSFPALDKAVEESYPVGYETVDQRHKEKRKDLNGQFIYAALLDIGGEQYIAAIKLDDTAADKRAYFKDISIKKRSLYVGQPQAVVDPSADRPLTVQQLVDYVKSDFAQSPLFSEKMPGVPDYNGGVRIDTDGYGDDNSKFSISPESDAEYLAAVKRGDMETAQRMVEERIQSDPDLREVKNLHNFLVETSMYGIPAELSLEMANWDYRSKSPYSFSYYSKPGKSWTHTPEGILRVSDHWNFESRGEKHAVTDRPVENGTHWTLAEYRDGVYHVLKTIPRTGANTQKDAVEKFTLDKIQKEYPELKLPQNRRGGQDFVRHKKTGELLGVIANDTNGKRYSVNTLDGKQISVLKENAEILSAAQLDEAGKYVYDTAAQKIKSADPVTYDDDGNVIPLSKRFNKRLDDVRFSVAPDEELELDRVNQAFNSELQKQINGELPKGYLYQLGRPGSILRSTGIPDLPIEMSSTRLAEKANAEHHLFDIEDVKDLPLYLNKPIGVFEYGNKDKAQNIVVEIQKEDKHFIVGLSLNFKHDGLVVNSIRGLYPKDTHEWLTWIQKNKSLYLNKEKIQALIAQQQTNPADVNYLDLDLISKIVRDFQNASVDEENSSRLSVAPDDAFVQAWAKVLLPVVSTQYINVDGAAAYLMDHGIEVYAGRDDDTLRKACVLAQTWKKERNKVVRGNREHKALEKKDPYYKILSGKFGRDFQINAGPKYDGTVFTGTWMDKHKTEKGRSGSITAAEAAKILTESTGKEVTEGVVVVWWNRQGGR